jgi:hypothetical protein
MRGKYLLFLSSPYEQRRYTKEFISLTASPFVIQGHPHSQILRIENRLYMIKLIVNSLKGV